MFFVVGFTCNGNLELNKKRPFGRFHLPSRDERVKRPVRRGFSSHFVQQVAVTISRISYTPATLRLAGKSHPNSGIRKVKGERT
jgi:hypothetical protein